MKKINIGRIKRYIKFGFESLLERQKGLDFTMRDLSAIKMSDGKYHGYAKTVEEHLHDVFRNLTIGEQDGILDIGCGKGTVLHCASQYPFGKICGIEIIPELVNTAKRNVKRLVAQGKWLSSITILPAGISWIIAVFFSFRAFFMISGRTMKPWFLL